MGSEPQVQLSLDRVVTYQITVPGRLEVQLTPWAAELSASYTRGVDAQMTTTLRGRFDQAALHGVLRRLYSLGLPLISVKWIEENPKG